MVEKIRKFYLSKKLFIISSVGAMCCYIADAIQAILNGQSFDYVLIMFSLVALLHWAFISGHINVQKMLFGAMLLAMLKEQIAILRIDIAYTGKVSVVDVCTIVMAAVIFISHLYQQMEHDGKSFATVINQFLGLTMVLFSFYGVLNFAFSPATIGNYIFMFGYALNCLMVICMETRVETYKQIRDKARKEGTWTEENRKEAKKLFALK